MRKTRVADLCRPRGRGAGGGQGGPRLPRPPADLRRQRRDRHRQRRRLAAAGLHRGPRRATLRPQSFEETVFCVGCHGGIGATDDFDLRLPAQARPAGGRLVPLVAARARRRPRPGRRRRVAATTQRYLMRERRRRRVPRQPRDHQRVLRRRRRGEAGRPGEAERSDVASLLYPSRRRALDLDKAYRTIVIDQDFVRGRDALPTPAENVYREVEGDQPTGIEDPLAHH